MKTLDGNDRQNFITLSWALGEFCMMYFYPDKVHLSWHESLTIKDTYYDKLEQEYRELAERLGESPYTVELVGFGSNTASASLVWIKLSQPKGKNNPVLDARYVSSYCIETSS